MTAPAGFEKKPFSPLNALKGVAIGLGNIVPGVSGGTVAVITGIYDELVDAFGNFFSGEGGWKKNLAFLVPVIAGALLGNIALARAIGWLLAAAPGPANFGFIGLILGSLPYLLRRSGIRSLRPRYLLLFAAGFPLVLWMGLAPSPAASPPVTELTLPAAGAVFAAALVSGVATAVPGVSGGFLLLLLGMYSTLRHGFGAPDLRLILLFTGGTIAGVCLVAKAAAAVLRRFHAGAYALIIGLVAGSAVTLYPGLSPGRMVWADIGSLAFGFGLSLFLGTGTGERLSSLRKNDL